MNTNLGPGMQIQAAQKYKRLLLYLAISISIEEMINFCENKLIHWELN